MLNSVLPRVEPRSCSTNSFFASPTHTTSDHPSLAAHPSQENLVPEGPLSWRKRQRVCALTPPGSPCKYDGPSTDHGDIELSSLYQRSPTPSLAPQDLQIPGALPDLPTPPGSDYAEDTDDDDNIPYPIRPRLIPPDGNSMILKKIRGRDLNRRAYTPGTPDSTLSASSDRFISNRSTPQDSAKSFRLGKPPHLLSPDEKLLRRESATPDPFVSPSPARSRHTASLLPDRNTRLANRSHSRSVSGPDILTMPHHAHTPPQRRQVSSGAVWNVGGGNSLPTGPVEGISNGRGGWIGSGTNAPLYTAKFLDKDHSEEDLDTYAHRLAIALDINRNKKVLDFSRPQKRERTVSGAKRKRDEEVSRTQWKYGEWTRPGDISPAKRIVKKEPKPVPTIPFRVLDAPQLRDDYYCSALSFCHSTRTLAVGLGNKVYLWSETYGVRYPQLVDTGRRGSYVTSLSFSSTEGGQSILAIGRNNGLVSLWSILDEGTRFEAQQPNSVACLSFKPVLTRRASVNSDTMVFTEELLVGDELGNVYYYAVEWVDNLEVEVQGWHGAMTLLAKISVHSQQICGLAWSPEGNLFATGANDNACCLFVVKDILTPLEMPEPPKPRRRPLTVLPTTQRLPDVLSSEPFRQRFTSTLSGHASDVTEVPSIGPVERAVSNPYILRAIPGRNGILKIKAGRQKHKWVHSAAIKAIAFCPWQPGLIATGGGSNDRAIHFYHTSSGACLATINVQAQVTSLIWSTSRHEIAATFGYAQPDHPYRIAVFSWPDCRQVVAIPWAQDMRALHAIAYPGGPNEKGQRAREGEAWWSRTHEEGCIVVACSDESVKFHEIWTGRRKSTSVGAGLLGGSDILEALEGFDKQDARTIR
ncbi:MAG: hypothetical protein L6R36_002455 [Xanthoria steineri]|nr:MAG: hypothetical protein L6R36_002455 [Xanthoria steineri]